MEALVVSSDTKSNRVLTPRRKARGVSAAMDVIQRPKLEVFQVNVNGFHSTHENAGKSLAVTAPEDVEFEKAGFGFEKKIDEPRPFSFLMKG